MAPLPLSLQYKGRRQRPCGQLQASGADSCVCRRDDITDAGRCDQLLKTVVIGFGRLDVIVTYVEIFAGGNAGGIVACKNWQNFLPQILAHRFVHAAVPRCPHIAGRPAWGGVINFGAARCGARVRPGENLGLRQQPRPRCPVAFVPFVGARGKPRTGSP